MTKRILIRIPFGITLSNYKSLVLFIWFALASLSVAQLRTGVPPGSNFDLNSWKLQTLNDNRSFLEIKPVQLPIHTSWFFYTDSTDGSMVFRTPINGKTTERTSHPRVELRQMSFGANWPLTDSTVHRLDAICRVVIVASDTPKTIIGQIHGNESKSQLLKLVWSGYKPGKCAVTVIFKTNDPEKKDKSSKLVTGLSLGEKINYTLTMKNGTITVIVNGISSSHKYTTEYYGTNDRYYFKAGNYIQCSGSDLNIFGIVKFYQLSLGY